MPAFGLPGAIISGVQADAGHADVIRRRHFRRYAGIMAERRRLWIGAAEELWNQDAGHA